MNARSLLTGLRRSAFAYCIVGSYALLPSFALAGVPALLQFAEQYQSNNSQAAEEKAPTAEKDKESKKLPIKNNTAQQKPPPNTLRWQTKEAELQRERIANLQLKQQLLALQKKVDEKSTATRPAAKVPAPDLAELGRLAQGLRRALAITPAEQQVVANLEHAQKNLDAISAREQKTRLDNKALKTQVTTLQTQLEATTAQAEKNAATTDDAFNARLQAITDDKTVLQSNLAKSIEDHRVLSLSNENLKEQLIALNDKNDNQRQQQDKLQNQHLTVQTSLESKVAELAGLRAEMTQLQERTPPAVTPEILADQQSRQNYAAGVSLGEEILQMQNERQKWGVNTDKQIMLTGIIDTFVGHKKMTDDELNQALEASEKQVASARDKVMSEQAKKGDSYLTRFRQDKKVRQTASGAWYRIDYAGDSAVTAGATLDVVIKEALTDGTVIQDMESSGAVLSQPITQFPPLFSEALGQLKNHGSLTLVVPPELAYGAKGYPPSVPPNATMVYTLRIAEIYPAKVAKEVSISTNKKPAAH
ncbi:FKBP-type peptidyl-prolyl cis-trans isomerase N-terminal domain-containing protein [Serratia inhibens]|uniref:FKBP-type peptidyl-prolyl cis-trans isomerase N-terminal domain-containing protein n=1 Tax=Serratia inhibens TaxID=2338073 RepID=UPI0008099727|nr:FKBP-type peptidyl-prolyl cis-trans isomerase N-terminal domain-containing protein [Serratia inhibens]ANS41615.1 FKBP-type peptidyl-prolyl cis-trans isomerase FkpA [Serratia inhibens PRI-2C]